MLKSATAPRVALCGALTLLLGGCYMPDDPFQPAMDKEPLAITSSASPRELSDTEKAIVTQAISAALPDPGSAQYTFLGYRGGYLYCGDVSAKGTHGFYTSDTFAVYVTHNAAGIIVGAQQPAVGPRDDFYCQKAGYKVGS